MAGNKFQTEDMMGRCVPMASVQAVLGGKWKILILLVYHFLQSPKIRAVDAAVGRDHTIFLDKAAP